MSLSWISSPAFLASSLSTDSRSVWLGDWYSSSKDRRWPRGLARIPSEPKRE